ncbi:MAG: adenosine deaminase family protein [Terriglobales bacterium]
MPSTHRTLRACLACALFLGTGIAQTSETATARVFAALQQRPEQLWKFLYAMPKGGDLHNHLSGAVYAETLIALAAAQHLCVDTQRLAFVRGPCAAAPSRPEPADSGVRVPAAQAFSDPGLYRALLAAFSMLGFRPGAESGHDHFFDTFGRFGAAADDVGALLAEVTHRAALQHELYLETMFNPDRGEAAGLGAKLGWNPDLTAFRRELLAAGMGSVVAAGRANLDAAEQRERALLHCGTPQADIGCGLTVRYLYQVGRGLPPERVFAQILAGFELASVDPRVVGLNLVMPEDGYLAMRDYTLHMQMVGYLHALYPKVHITLHAGELAPGLVPPGGLTFHIRQAVEIAHAERIGHGVDVTTEIDAPQLLEEMASHHVAVEICLTSNAEILGVEGAAHPLPVYLRYGVPVSLATDDEGVSRSDLTREFLRAVATFHLTYPELKQMARNSLEYSFLPGASLWREAHVGTPVTACAAASLTPACKTYLEASPRAALQWREEEKLRHFERGWITAAGRQ